MAARGGRRDGVNGTEVTVTGVTTGNLGGAVTNVLAQYGNTIQPQQITKLTVEGETSSGYIYLDEDDLSYIDQYLASLEILDLSDMALFDTNGAGAPDTTFPAVFQNHATLEEIYLPNNIETVDVNAFDGNTALKVVGFPDTLKKIDDYAFRGTSLTAVEFPDTLEDIGESDFEDCADLASVVFNVANPTVFNTIGESAFKDCVSLTEIDLPDGLAVIDENTFDGCEYLTDVTFPDTLTNVNDEAFKDTAVTFFDWTDLTGTVTVGTGKDAFDGVESLEILVDDSATSSYYGTGTDWEAVQLGGDVTVISTLEQPVITKVEQELTTDLFYFYIDDPASMSGASQLDYEVIIYDEGVTPDPIWTEFTETANQLTAASGTPTPAHDYGANVTNWQDTTPNDLAIYTDYKIKIRAVDTHGTYSAVSRWTDIEEVMQVTDDAEAPEFDDAVGTSTGGANVITGFESTNASYIGYTAPASAGDYGIFEYSYSQGQSPAQFGVSVAAPTNKGDISYTWYKAVDPSNPDPDVDTVLLINTTGIYTPPTSAVGVSYYYVVATNYRSGALNDTEASVSSAEPGTGSSGSTYDESLVKVTVQGPGNASAPTVTITSPFNYTTDDIALNTSGATNFYEGITLTAEATLPSTDDGVLTYYWYDDTDTLLSNTANTNESTLASFDLELDDITPADLVGMTGPLTYDYYLVVVNNNPGFLGTNVESTRVDFTVTIDPVDVGQPEFVIPTADTTYTVEENDALTLTARVDGGLSGVLTYEWYSNTTGVADPTVDTLITTGVSSSGYITNLTVDTSTLGDIYYYVVVTHTDTASNITGITVATDTSKLMKVEVVAAGTIPTVDAETPVFSTQPQDDNYDVNDPANALTVAASVSDGGTVTYEWFVNTTNSTTGGTSVGTGDSYTPDTTVAGTYYYYAVATNYNPGVTGNDTATAVSSVATIVVTDPNTPPVTKEPAETPTFTKDLSDASYEENDSVRFEVEAQVSDSGTITYQWYSNTTNSTTGGTPISGATGATYTPDTSTLGTTYYYVVATNTVTYSDGSTDTATATSNIAEITIVAAGTTFTVTFVDGTYVLDTQTVAVGETVTQPEDPEKEGYVFTGWYADADCTVLYDFDEPVTGDLTIYSGWEELEWHEPYVSGNTDGTFGPNNNLSRAEAAAMFYNLLDADEKNSITGGKSFSDVATSAWYYNAVTALSAMGVISGDANADTFRPGSPITRAEFASMVQIFFDLPDGTTVNFPGVASDHWAYTAIASVSEAGIVSGDTNGRFNPNNNITRAETVAMLNSAQGRFTDASLYEGLEMPFSDVAADHWAWEHIMEAAVGHYHPAD